jgi:hypothetical protein
MLGAVVCVYASNRLVLLPRGQTVAWKGQNGQAREGEKMREIVEKWSRWSSRREARLVAKSREFDDLFGVSGGIEEDPAKIVGGLLFLIFARIARRREGCCLGRW